MHCAVRVYVHVHAGSSDFVTLHNVCTVKSSATQTSYAATPHTAGGMKTRAVWTAGVWYKG